MGLFVKLSKLPRSVKHWMLGILDVFILAFSIWAAVSLRLGEYYVPAHWTDGIVLAVAVACGSLIFIRFGLYRQVVRYMDMASNLRIVYGVTLTMMSLGLLVAISRFDSFPRSSFLLFWIVAVALTVASRRAIQFVLSSLNQRQHKQELDPAKPVLIYGAGKAGHMLAKELKRVGTHQPIYFIDDDQSLWGQKVSSLKVRAPDDIAKVIADRDVKDIFLAVPSLSTKRRREIVMSLETFPVAVKTVPSISEIVTDNVAISNVRPIDASDLLCREPVPPKLEILQKTIKGKSLLVTGAGGSIGSEIVNQLLKLQLGPKRIVLYDISEAALYQVEMKVRELLEQRAKKARKENRIETPCEVVSCLGSILNADDLRLTIKKYDISTIYHAAAYKHVPIVELNPFMGLNNNTIGTSVIAEIAHEMQIERFVLVSTDKAVRPTNIMGASKRLAELAVQATAARSDSKTIFSMVRFGNVLASSGSVVHRFKKQIEDGGPLTVTHPDVTRYFMSIEEAAQLVIQSATIANSGDLFILDMGDPIKIDGLARLMIRLAGMNVDENGDGTGDIAIEYTGLRPGEKLYEELLLASKTGDTDHPRIKRCDEPFISSDQLDVELKILEQAIVDHDIKTVQDLLFRLVEGYQSDTHRQKETAAA
ncbi:MAG: polysaccharide biosynthesis protein [Hyphomicrobiaceae bacterium]